MTKVTIFNATRLPARAIPKPFSTKNEGMNEIVICNAVLYNIQGNDPIINKCHSLLVSAARPSPDACDCDRPGGVR